MNTVVTKRAATRAPKPPTPPAPPVSQSKAPAPGWRTFARNLLMDLQVSLDEAMRIDPDSCPHTRFLILDAGTILRSMLDMVRNPNTNRSDMLDPLFHLESFLFGAVAMEQTPKALRALLEQPIAALDNASASFDEGGLDDEPAEAAHLADDHVTEDHFMAGKALAADLLDAAQSLSADNTVELLAMYRGRNVPQVVFMRDYFETVVARPHLAEGFFASLSAFTALAFAGPIDPEQIREATYLDCVGGPDTVYVEEEETQSTASVGQQPDQPSVPPEKSSREPSDTPEVITRETYIQNGGEIGRNLMLRCTWEVAAMADLIVKLSDEGMASGEFGDGSLPHQLRGSAIHIHNLNSRLMSSLSDDSTTLWEAANTLHCEDDLIDMLDQQEQEGTE
jgi:hypothetical protein